MTRCDNTKNLHTDQLSDNSLSRCVPDSADATLGKTLYGVYAFAPGNDSLLALRLPFRGFYTRGDSLQTADSSAELCEVSIRRITAESTEDELSLVKKLGAAFVLCDSSFGAVPEAFSHTHSQPPGDAAASGSNGYFVFNTEEPANTALSEALEGIAGPETGTSDQPLRELRWSFESDSPGERIGSRNIALVGFMGCGKTTIGAELAHRSGLGFIDIDSRIEKAEGMPIADIFRLRGEAYFRTREREELLAAFSESGNVIATGGGAVLSSDSRAIIRSRSIAVWLYARPDTSYMRASGKGRPLLESGIDNARELMASRFRFYFETSDIIVDAEKSVSGIARILYEDIGSKIAR